LSRWAVEDDMHLLVAAGSVDFTRGSKEDRRRRYLDLLHRFPQTIERDVLEQAEMASEVIIAPESLMRGFFRTPTGPGWGLVGDACHFKHPGTAQGIADAVEQAIYIAETLSDGDLCLDGYEEWRDGRALEHYEWSFSWGRFPRPESEPLFRGWSSEADAGQDLRDSFSRRVKPSQAMSKERLERWFRKP
jgi:2-polyprenyl-6-methoxyphenol hydroxylase-like FAD-dependent oxidoreductase